ncbi:transposase-like protein [Polaromonas sp. CG_23.6]|nr:transposase-like protein [Polaromonas sp. CG_23.6]
MRILVNEASRIERAQHLQATPYERSAQRVDYANGYKNKTVLTRMGEVTFEVPQVRSGGFYPSALERQPFGAGHESGAGRDVRAGRLHPKSH